MSESGHRLPIVRRRQATDLAGPALRPGRRRRGVPAGRERPDRPDHVRCLAHREGLRACRRPFPTFSCSWPTTSAGTTPARTATHRFTLPAGSPRHSVGSSRSHGPGSSCTTWPPTRGSSGTAALEPDDVVLGGGNVKKLKELPGGCRIGDNADAFAGGFRLWDAIPGSRS